MCLCSGRAVCHKPKYFENMMANSLVNKLEMLEFLYRLQVTLELVWNYNCL